MSIGTNLETMTNERGRDINYTVFDPRTGAEMFSFLAGRFSQQMIAREAAKRGIALPVRVTWITLNRWGFDKHFRTVSA